jgi:hypothetical protein
MKNPFSFLGFIGNQFNQAKNATTTFLDERASQALTFFENKQKYHVGNHRRWFCYGASSSFSKV